MTMLGHDAPPTSFWKENLITRKPLERCPLRTLILAKASLVHELQVYRTELWPLWERGHLMSAGGVEDQSARYIDYMREFDLTQVIVDRKAKELSKAE